MTVLNTESAHGDRPVAARCGDRYLFVDLQDGRRVVALRVRATRRTGTPAR